MIEHLLFGRDETVDAATAQASRSLAAGIGISHFVFVFRVYQCIVYSCLVLEFSCDAVC